MGKIIINLPLMTATDVSTDDRIAIEDVSAPKTKSININELRKVVGIAMYPVGSIYVNASDGTNPSTLLGFGTWVAWGSGRVPVGVDSGQTEFDTVEKTGGAKTHTLTQAQIPNYSIGFLPTAVPGYHSQWDNGGVKAGGQWKKMDNVTQVGAANNQSNQYGWDLSTNGGGQAHNNIQPYITCYMWKRTA